MLAGLGTAAGGVASGVDLAPLQSGLDYHSFANVEQFRVTHLELELHVDMDAHLLRGAAGLAVKRLDPGATELILDTRDLDVTAVVEKAQGVLGAMSKTETTWVSRPYHFQRKDALLGQALVIELPPSKKSTEFIRIEYQTSPTAPSLLWVAPDHTAGKHRPFLATLSEPIGARGWIPLQDTPQVRFTYAATIHTDGDLLAVMSAKNEAQRKGKAPKRSGDYSFVMADPVPSFLIALAVGDLKFKETGTRTGVYAEKSVLGAALQEFADGDALLRAGERLAGAYPWDRHDAVVMPPGFPVAVSAHPRLAFLSPTVLSGRKSGAVHLARGMAQSWSGEVVGNSTWADQWLSHGLGDYWAGRMLGAVYGEQTAALVDGADALRLRAELPLRGAGDQALEADLRGRDPAAECDGFVGRKGALFFAFLDARFGTERLDAYLHGYVEHFSFGSVTTQQFVNHLEDNLLKRFPGVLSRPQVLEWMGPGIPADAVWPRTDGFASVEAARAAWLGGAGAKTMDTHSWQGDQWVYFLDGLPQTLTTAQQAELDHAFDFSHSPDGRVAEHWFVSTVRHPYQQSAAALEQFLQTVGRTQLVLPLYEALMQTRSGATQARRVYAKARPGYSASTAAAVDAVVDPESAGTENTDD